MRIEAAAILGNTPCLPVALGAGVAGDALEPAEWQGTAMVSAYADALLAVEWSAVPEPVLLSLGLSGKRRLLTTPGRRRILKRP